MLMVSWILTDFVERISMDVDGFVDVDGFCISLDVAGFVVLAGFC